MKKLVSLVVSLGILALIYWKLSQHGQLAQLGHIFADCDRLWMVLSLGMVVPLTLFTSWRLQQLMPRTGQLGFGEANKLILVASVLNLILPSKMGDIAKAWFMKDRGHLEGSLALSLVVFEKACDMLSLLLWCVFGLAWIKWSDARALAAFHLPAQWAEKFGPAQESLMFWFSALVVCGSLLLGVLLLGSQTFAGFFFATAARYAPRKIGAKFAKLGASWNEMHRYFWESKARLAKVTITSVFIWFLHLLQIWMFILALKAWAPFLANLALSPLAILAGLLPLTFAGVGTRDAALVLFYKPYFDAPVAAALGLLCTARYLLPAIGGLPFAGQYLAAVKTAKKAELAGEAAGS
ncbi:MAG: glycosyltransferase 2 family protein [Chthoniobacter sp.]|nr:glycosyltransferase 2 family protein [Chthoniobacter sp.]